MSGRTVIRAALATALASIVVVVALPLLLGVEAGSPGSAVALAATLVALEALAFAPRLLPVAVALYAAAVVLAVHRGDLAEWSVAPLAAALLLLVESAELRRRLPDDCVVERDALRAHVRRLVLVGGTGLVAAAVALAAGGLSGRGGAGAGIVGAAAIGATLLLVRGVARSSTSSSDAP